MKEVEIEVITDNNFADSDSAVVVVYPKGEWVLRDGFEFQNIEGYPLCMIELGSEYQLDIDDSLTFYYSNINSLVKGYLHTKCFTKLSKNRYVLERTSDRIIASQNIVGVIKNYYGFGPNSVRPVYSYFAKDGKKEDPAYHLFACKVHDSIDEFVVMNFAEGYMPKRAYLNVRKTNFGTVTLLHEIDYVYRKP